MSDETRETTMESSGVKEPLNTFQKRMGGLGIGLGIASSLLGLDPYYKAYATLAIYGFAAFSFTVGISTFKRWAIADTLGKVFFAVLIVIVGVWLWQDMTKPRIQVIPIAIHILILCGLLLGCRKNISQTKDGE